MCRNSRISKHTLLISEITRQFAFISVQKNSNYVNRPDIGNFALLLFVFLIEGETEAEYIDWILKRGKFIQSFVKIRLSSRITVHCINL